MSDRADPSPHQAAAPPNAPGILGQQLLTGSFWATLDGWTSEIANLLLYLTLARLLGPADFGLVALAGVFAALASSVTVYAVQQVIIQKPDLEPADCDAVFVLTMGGSIGATLLLTFASPVIAGLLREPELAPILLWLSFGVVLHALGAVPLGLLTRELRFAATARRSLLMIACGGAVGVGMAIAGYGVWALVAQHVVGAAVSSLTLLTATTWRPGWRARRRHFRAVWRYVASSVGNRLLTFAGDRGPQLVIGYMLGPAATGIYNVAMRLVDVMTRLFVVPINQITMPGFARVQHEPAQVRRLQRAALATATLVSAPAFIGAAVTAPVLIDLMFGAEWAAMAPVLQILALRGLLSPALLQGESLLYGLGHPQRMLHVNIADLGVTLLLLVLVAPFGLVPAAAAMTARAVAWRWPLLASRSEAAAALGWAEQARIMAPPVLCAAGMAGLLAYGTTLLPPTLPAPVGLAFTVAAGALIYLALSLLLNRSLLADTGRRLKRLAQPVLAKGMRTP